MDVKKLIRLWIKELRKPSTVLCRHDYRQVTSGSKKCRYCAVGLLFKLSGKVRWTNGNNIHGLVFKDAPYPEIYSIDADGYFDRNFDLAAEYVLGISAVFLNKIININDSRDYLPEPSGIPAEETKEEHIANVVEKALKAGHFNVGGKYRARKSKIARFKKLLKTLKKEHA